MKWIIKKLLILTGHRLAEADWRWVPPPNYRCSRGKQTNAKYGDYW